MKIGLTIQAKINISAFLIICLLIWPLVHRYLQHEFSIHPWRFFGMAMYAEPTLELGLKVSIDKKGKERPVNPEELPPVVQHNLTRFYLFFESLGTIVSPETVAGQILELYDADYVILAPQRRALDPYTGKVFLKEWPYRY